MPPMNGSQPISPRQRLQELLAIPEGQRTDAQWDELNELEIKLASGNRQDAPEQGRRNAPSNTGNPRPGGGPHGKNRGGFAKQSRRRR